MLNRIYLELKEHLPFTFFGAFTGILLMLVFKDIPHEVSHTVFYILHPMHVLLSALVTASMYGLHKCGCIKGKCNLIILIIIGFTGSIGIATISDSLIPYFAETLLDMPNREAHIGFIEKWWLITPLAALGIAIAYFKPSTKFPHAGHVLLSTWTSLFHVLMARNGALDPASYAVIFLFLFIAVWLPCCISDIVFPLLFIRSPQEHHHD